MGPGPRCPVSVPPGDTWGWGFHVLSGQWAPWALTGWAPGPPHSARPRPQGGQASRGWSSAGQGAGQSLEEKGGASRVVGGGREEEGGGEMAP